MASSEMGFSLVAVNGGGVAARWLPLVYFLFLANFDEGEENGE